MHICFHVMPMNFSDRIDGTGCLLELAKYFPGINLISIHLPCCSSVVVVLVVFCGASYLEVVSSRDDQIPTNGDFLASLLPLVCIPAVLSLCSGLHKW